MGLVWAREGGLMRRISPPTDERTRKTKRSSVKLPRPRLDPKTLPEFDYYGKHGFVWMTSTEKRIRKERCINAAAHDWAVQQSPGKPKDSTFVFCRCCGELSPDVGKRLNKRR